MRKRVGWTKINGILFAIYRTEKKIIIETNIKTMSGDDILKELSYCTSDLKKVKSGETRFKKFYEMVSNYE